MKQVDLVFLLIGAVVVALVIAVFSTSGNPFERQRQARDQEILSAFSQIKLRIENYHQTNKQVPDSLEQLEKATTTGRTPPATKQNFTYKKLSTISYDLCATFEAESAETGKDVPPMYEPDSIDTTHKSGFDCITYKIPSYLIATPTPRYFPQ
ncbi:MAG: hypothetical protein M3Q44_03460 [bacterium]|nr:hypothetical protein [bacterium]